MTTDGPFADTNEVFGGYYWSTSPTWMRLWSWGPDPVLPARRQGRGPSDRGAAELIEQLFSEQWGRVLASLVGFLGDFDLAEEAAQEAFAIAAERWPRDGTPASPVEWLVATARNRAIDRIRRERTLAEKTRQLEVPETPMDEIDDRLIGDERLELIFTCCHPALAPEAQVPSRTARWED